MLRCFRAAQTLRIRSIICVPALRTIGEKDPFWLSVALMISSATTTLAFLLLTFFPLWIRIEKRESWKLVREGGNAIKGISFSLLSFHDDNQLPPPAKLSIPYPLDVDETSLLAMHMSWKSSLESRNTAGIYFLYDSHFAMRPASVTKATKI